MSANYVQAKSCDLVDGIVKHRDLISNEIASYYGKKIDQQEEIVKDLQLINGAAAYAGSMLVGKNIFEAYQARQELKLSLSNNAQSPALMRENKLAYESAKKNLEKANLRANIVRNSLFMERSRSNYPASALKEVNDEVKIARGKYTQARSKHLQTLLKNNKASGKYLKGFVKGNIQKSGGKLPYYLKQGVKAFKRNPYLYIAIGSLLAHGLAFQNEVQDGIEQTQKKLEYIENPLAILTIGSEEDKNLVCNIIAKNYDYRRKLQSISSKIEQLKLKLKAIAEETNRTPSKVMDSDLRFEITPDLDPANEKKIQVNKN